MTNSLHESVIAMQTNNRIENIIQLVAHKEDTFARIRPEIIKNEKSIDEVSLSLEMDTLRDEHPISFENDDDLRDQIVNFLYKNANMHVNITKDESFISIYYKALNEIESIKHRGSCTVIICSSKFFNKHATENMRMDNIKIVINNSLPPDIAITNYLNNNDISAIACVNYIEKVYFVKMCENYVCVLKEDEN